MSQNIIDLTWDIAKFDAQTQAVIKNMTEVYNLGKQISETAIKPGSMGGFTELKNQSDQFTKLAEAQNNYVQSAQRVVQVTAQQNLSIQQNVKKLNDYKNALAENSAALKELQKQGEKSGLSADEYRFKINKLTEDQFKYKQSISEISKEIKAQQALNASPQNTIASAKAQNKVLIAQRDLVDVNDVERLKELNTQIDKNNDLIDKNNDLLSRQKINIGNYPNAFGGAFKTLNKELDQVQSKLSSGNLGGESVSKLTTKLNVLQNAASLTGKEFKTVAQEQKAYQEAAVKIGQVYGKNSDVFKNFASQVKEGAAANASLSKEVTGVVSKGRGFLGFLQTAYTGLRKLAYAIPGIGIGGLILLLLGPLQAAGAAIVKWSESATKGAREFKDFEDHIKNSQAVLEKSADSFAKATSEVSKLTQDVKLAKEGIISKDEVLKEYNDTMGKTTGHLKSLDELEAKLVADGPDYIKLLFLKAEATAAYALAGQAAQKVLTAQSDAEKDFGKEDFIGTNKVNLLKQVFGFNADAAADAGLNAANQVKKNAAKIKEEQQKAFVDLNKQGDDFERQAAELAKKHNWHLIPEKDGLKKAHADSENLLDEFRKKDLEALAKYSNDNLKILQELYKEQMNDQLASYDDRLRAAQKYYDASNQLTANQRKTEEDALNLEVNTANKKAAKIQDPKLRAETELVIQKYKVDKLKEIDQTFQNGSLKNDKSFYADKVKISLDAYEKIKKESQEAAKFIQEQQKIAFQNMKDQLDINKDNKLLELQKSYKAGSLKDLEEFNAKKKAIEDAADLEHKKLELKRVQDAEKITEVLYGVQNINLIKQGKDLEVAIAEAGNKKILDSQKALLDAKKQLQQEEYDLLNKAIEATQSFVDADFDRQKEKYAKEEKLLDERTKKEVDALNSSTLSQQEKAAQEKQINTAAALQKKQLQDKQKQEDIEKAKFDKAISVIQIGITTAEAVAKITAAAAVARATYAAIPGIGLAAGATVAGTLLAQIPLVIATGALEVAAVLAKPIPAYAKGTKNHPGGPAIVGEGQYKELVSEPSGKSFIADKAMLINNLPKGSKVTPLTSDAINQAMYHAMMISTAEKLQSVEQPNRDKEIIEAIKEGSIMTVRAMKKQKGTNVVVNVYSEWGAYIRKNVIE